METPFRVWLPQVTIARCQRLEQCQQAVEAVRSRHCVVLQLDAVEPQEAQRIVDFVAGAVCALDGSMERIGEHTLLCSPAGVNVSHG